MSKCFRVRSCDAKLIISLHLHIHCRQTRGVPMEVDRVKCLVFSVTEAHLRGACEHQKIYELYVAICQCSNLPARLLVWLMEYKLSLCHYCFSSAFELLQTTAVCCHCSNCKMYDGCVNLVQFAKRFRARCRSRSYDCFLCVSANVLSIRMCVVCFSDFK